MRPWIKKPGPDSWQQGHSRNWLPAILTCILQWLSKTFNGKAASFLAPFTPPGHLFLFLQKSLKSEQWNNTLFKPSTVYAIHTAVQKAGCNNFLIPSLEQFRATAVHQLSLKWKSCKWILKNGLCKILLYMHRTRTNLLSERLSESLARTQ